jgi:hypothetical protein
MVLILRLATYDHIRSDWQENIRTAEAKLFEAERSIQNVQVDLDLALILLANANILYERLEENDRVRLLKIFAKRIIVNPDGLIVDQELNSPLPYLRNLAGSSGGSHRDSEQVRLGAPKTVYPEQLSENEQFLDQVRFDQRSKLAELPDFGKRLVGILL